VGTCDLARVERLHRAVAALTADDPIYLPIFERMEAELITAQAEAAHDPVAAARARLEARRMMA